MSIIDKNVNNATNIKKVVIPLSNGRKNSLNN
jgi:hypothetical protein